MVQHHSASYSKNTIWRPITEESFITAVSNVFHASKQTAGSLQIYEGKSQLTPPARTSLSFDVAYQLAKDLAFIAAFEEQAEAVSAVTVSEQIADKGVYWTIASNAGVKPTAKRHFYDIANVLEKCAKSDIEPAFYTQQLFDLVVEFDQARIISRLKCGLWTPKYHGSRPPPLCTSLRQTFNIIMASNPPNRNDLTAIVEGISHMANLVTKADSEGVAAVKENLKSIVERAGTLTGSRLSLENFLDIRNVKTTVEGMKAVRAFDKVANYWHLCQRLIRVATSKRSRSLLKSIHLQFLEPFGRHKVNGHDRHVHAEVQIVTFHRQQKTDPSPRAIGTSKAACYLCDLFLSQHPEYRYSATHGMLYEFWTIPDISNYTSADREKLRSVIAFMYRTLNIRAQSRSHGLMFPIQSGIYQPPYFPSATATTVCSSSPSLTNQSLPICLSGPSAEGKAFSTLQNNIYTNGTESDSSQSTCRATARMHSQEGDQGNVQLNTNKDLPEISESRSSYHYQAARTVEPNKNGRLPMPEGPNDVHLTALKSAKKKRTRQEKLRVRRGTLEKSRRKRRHRRHGVHGSQHREFDRLPRRRGLHQPAKRKKYSRPQQRHGKGSKKRRKYTTGVEMGRQSNARRDARVQSDLSPWQILKVMAGGVLASCCGVFSFSYEE